MDFRALSFWCRASLINMARALPRWRYGPMCNACHRGCNLDGCLRIDGRHGDTSWLLRISVTILKGEYKGDRQPISRHRPPHNIYPFSKSRTQESCSQRRYAVVDMTHDYYQLLHVLPDAPAPVIKASYRAMMQKLRHHPDLGGDPSRAQLLNEAVDTLCTPARRTIYDRELQRLKKRLQQEAAPATPTTGNAAPSREAANDKSRTNCNANTPGGRPNGYASRTEPPDECVNRKPEPGAASAVPKTQLPTRPHCLFCKASFSTTPLASRHYMSDDQCHQCQAPAAPLEQLNTSTTEELRRIYRHDHQAAVRLWTHWPMESHLKARLQDLSLAGCALESDQVLTGNTMVLLDTDALKAICEVRYCKPVGNGATFSIGLAFKTLKIKARPGTMFSAVA